VGLTRDDPHRQAPHFLVTTGRIAIAWRSRLYRQALHQYSELYWFRPLWSDSSPFPLIHDTSHNYLSCKFHSILLNLPYLCLTIIIIPIDGFTLLATQISLNQLRSNNITPI